MAAEALELSREEILKILDAGARKRLRMSGVEMVRRYRSGKLDDPGRVGDLLVLAGLLDDDDPALAA